MKRFLLLIISVLLALNANAQQENKHLTFKGIPIDGSLSSFITKLEKQGFSLETTYDNAAMMKGNFGGENCEIGIYSTANANSVFQIIVAFPKSSTWASLKAIYNKYKDALTKKYGKPEVIEKFYSPYDEGDGYEMSAIKADKCLYSSKFYVEHGIIQLVIFNSANIGIAYTDKINKAIDEDENDASVYNDI